MRAVRSFEARKSFRSAPARRRMGWERREASIDPCSRRTPVIAPPLTSWWIHFAAGLAPRGSAPTSASAKASASARSTPMATARRSKASHSSCRSETMSSRDASSSSSSEPSTLMTTPAPSSSSAPVSRARPGSASSSSPSSTPTRASLGRQSAAQSLWPKNSPAYRISVGRAPPAAAPAPALGAAAGGTSATAAAAEAARPVVGSLGRCGPRPVGPRGDRGRPRGAERRSALPAGR
mmetsp:Transcript_46625/g.141440  ORF Transcript_46625/g.141440 Transcript_46625/m.141440 type:complete len:237 (-) Transcript_46625:94-804(-)